GRYRTPAGRFTSGRIGMLDAYIRAMDVLHRLCMLAAGASIVLITLIIPWGVFTRYVLESAASWPEPMAVLVMIVFAFTSATVCYREGLHIAVLVLPNMLTGIGRAVLGWIVEILMGATNLFLLVYGTRLVATTWHQTIAEFPNLS